MLYSQCEFVYIPRMKKTESLTYLIVLIVFLSASAFALEISVIPDNYLSIPPVLTSRMQLKSLNQQPVTEEDFNIITKKIHKLYAPMIKEKYNVELIIETDWLSPVVNANASREENVWKVHVAGGMARAKGMSKEALTLVVCHELGHHLGGAPRSHLYGGWPSAEGQADYWATSKCLKNYYTEFYLEEVLYVNQKKSRI